MHTLGFTLAALLAALSLPRAASAEDERVTIYAPLRTLADCLDPDRARSWHMIDSDEVLVDAGRKRFHLQLQFSCPELGYEHSIVFRAGTAIGRLCGHPGDAIVTAEARGRRTSCPVANVTLLDREEYESLITAQSHGDRDP
jgi:hypothetical protein